MMHTIFTRKPRDLDEVKQNMQYLDSKEWIEITEEIQLTTEQYEQFWHNPTCGEYSYLAGKGGYSQGCRRAVLLTCEGRGPIIVDPSGSNYGRYVGFQI